ncbi:MAG: PIG-L family deacetylase [Anaerolineae bacterium]|nr:PIG-L family deacetylase [Anaerolineae bacterium]
MRRLLLRQLERRAVPISAADLARSAVVVSPHYDDETLGCGATVLRKRAAGASVRLVFMTDGGGSHEGLIAKDELIALRRAEGDAAASRLGLDQDHVFHLGEPERGLEARLAEVSARLRDIFAACAPQEIYLPYRGEPPLWSSDHRMTTRAALDAAAAWGAPVTLYEYPVWAWYSWPQVALNMRRPSEARRVLMVTARGGLGARLWREMNCRVAVGDALEPKRAALLAHRSQTMRLREGVGWPILADVAGGEFLACFFGQYEYFRRTTVQG